MKFLISKIENEKKVKNDDFADIMEAELRCFGLKKAQRIKLRAMVHKLNNLAVD